MRRLAALALVAGVACGGDGAGPSGPIALDPTTPPATKSVAPRPTAKPKPTPTATPTPTPTTPPPPTGTVVTTNGALVALAPPDAPRRVAGGADCATVFPEVTSPRCNAVALHGGSLLWMTGRMDGVAVVRLLTQDASGGYVTRYAGRDDAGTWGPVSVFAAPLTGRGTDGLVVSVRLNTRALSYDVLTWFKGGPLVLRAHRGPLTDGRLVARNGNLEDYALVPDGRYAHRTLAWDGRYFRATAPRGVTGADVPPR